MAWELQHLHEGHLTRLSPLFFSSQFANDLPDTHTDSVIEKEGLERFSLPGTFCMSVLNE